MDWAQANSVDFGSMTPEDLVEYGLDATPRQMNKILDFKKDYVMSLKGRVSSKATANKCVMSFFSHNRVNLPHDKTLNINGDTPKVESSLTPEDIKRLVMGSNELYQAVYLVMLGSGMGQEECVYWSDTGLEELRAQLSKDPKLVKISFHGRKNDKNAYNYHTYIGGDALRALKRYLAIRDPEPGAIFITNQGEGLNKNTFSRYWTRKLQRLNLGGGYTGKNPHSIRDVFRTLWRASGVATEYAEFFMGHRGAFDAYGYDQTAKNEEDLRARYSEALPFFNILTENKPFKVVNEEEVTKLRKELEHAKVAVGEVEELKTQMAFIMELLKTKK